MAADGGAPELAGALTSRLPFEQPACAAACMTVHNVVHVFRDQYCVLLLVLPGTWCRFSGVASSACAVHASPLLMSD